jgi:hypothetical protein
MVKPMMPYLSHLRRRREVPNQGRGTMMTVRKATPYGKEDSCLRIP